MDEDKEKNKKQEPPKRPEPYIIIVHKEDKQPEKRETKIEKKK
jgi:hypothetical protein